jgi:transcriptional regulator with XRE-family HTH domain
MSNREALNKRIRFEVFKRDKFTCQYCGAKSPEVVLNVDHIDPIANGGTNELLNLITSCHTCNNGKSDRILTDSSIVEKQRKQLELLEERREQIELMLEWKKSLSTFENDVVAMITDYANSKIQPFSLNDSGKASVSEWLKKFSTEKILDAVDISAKQYIKYEKGEVTNESAEVFLNKIGGILVVQKLPPVKQKIAYVKGIARNRFSYWNDRNGSIVLANYVAELEKHYDEKQVMNDLETEVVRITKDAKNWSEWKSILEGWTSDIEKWEKKEERPSAQRTEAEFSNEQLENFVYHQCCDQNDAIKALEHIATIFPEFDQTTFRQVLIDELIQFLTLHNDFENEWITEENVRQFIGEHIQMTLAFKQFHFGEYTVDNLGILIVLNPIVNELLIDIFSYCYYPIRTLKREYLKLMVELNILELKNDRIR